ncbi:MAG: phosphatase PAP2 family protein [Prevotella sp.]|nr:phosphatase PAP2 family protein [Prevotella sp.]
MDWDALIHLDKQLLLMLNGSDSLFLDGLAKTLTAAPTWIPLYLALLYLVLKNNDAIVKVLLVLAGAGLCVLLAGTVDDAIVKPWMARWRPTHDGEIGMLVDVVNGYRGGRFGFFSAHASNTFSIAIFFSLLIRSRVLSVSLVAWSLVNCWTRLYLGVHYPGDVFCGLLWGALVGTGVWFLHRYVYGRLFETKVFISKQYTTTGYEHRDVDVVIAVLVFTLVYAILRACFYLYV